ncbi:MAG: flagellar basal body-associated FliL family protein [Spirochaetota bacterium]|nr:flagellar basal body-associated FliL family protein [Spirochaetota bacterium]
MADEDSVFEDEEEEEGGQEEEKRSSGLWLKILTYLGLFLGVALISAITSIVVYELRGEGIKTVDLGDIVGRPTAPRDVYQVPEFKLALDKKDEESMTTIVQVKLGLAYEAENQLILDEIIKRKQQIRDKVQYVIARKSYEEISSSTNREEILKEDLRNALNSIIEGEILDIYFDTFVISRVPG